MRTKHSPLLPIFRSRLQGQLLAAVLLVPEGESSISELAERVEADVATVQREVDRLHRAGIFRTRRVGRTRLVSANPQSPLNRPLTQLVLITFGPLEILSKELRGIEGIESAFVFGSWAERYQGNDGPEPADIDVLVVGTPDRDELYDAALRAEELLQRRIDMTVRTRDSWTMEDGLRRQLTASALIPIPAISRH